MSSLGEGEVGGVGGSEGIWVQRVQEVFWGIGVFLKNLLHVSSRYTYLYQLDIGSYIKVIHLYNPFSLFLLTKLMEKL